MLILSFPALSSIIGIKYVEWQEEPKGRKKEIEKVVCVSVHEREDGKRVRKEKENSTLLCSPSLFLVLF